MDTENTRSRMALDQSGDLTRLQDLFDRWNQKEIIYVRLAASLTRRLFLQRFFTLVTLLSNGWIYAGVVLLILINQGWSAWPVLLCGGVAAGVCHVIYPMIKKRLARVRPCQVDSELDSCVRVLDEYSCPSGHIMTAVAVSIPLAIYFPSLIYVIVSVCVLIAWSRVALGHHYPSDLLLGALLASFVSLPISYPLI